MSQPKPSLEIIAPSIEEAIAQGAEELGIPKENLTVEILDEGTKGFLGLGTRQARVRLTIREGLSDQQSTTQESTLEPETPVAPEVQEGSPTDDEEAIVLSKATVKELLEKMKIKVFSHKGKCFCAYIQGLEVLFCIFHNIR